MLLFVTRCLQLTSMDQMASQLTRECTTIANCKARMRSKCFNNRDHMKLRGQAMHKALARHEHTQLDVSNTCALHAGALSSLWHNHTHKHAPHENKHTASMRAKTCMVKSKNHTACTPKIMLKHKHANYPHPAFTIWCTVQHGVQLISCAFPNMLQFCWGAYGWPVLSQFTACNYMPQHAINQKLQQLLVAELMHKGSREQNLEHFEQTMPSIAELAECGA